MTGPTYCRPVRRTFVRPVSHPCRPAVRCRGLKENVAQLPPIDNILRVRIPAAGYSKENQEGKKASVAIYNHLAQQHDGQLNKAATLVGLELYAEYVEEAHQHPGSHPNIDLLLKVANENLTLGLVVDKQQ